MTLNEKQLAKLREYAHTHNGLFMQGTPGASELETLGLLEWHGTQYGCHFYSITEEGRTALAMDDT